MLLMGVPNGTATLDNSLAGFFHTLSTLILYDPEIAFFGICLNKLKTYSHTKTYRWVFMAALFIIAKT